MSKFSSRPVLIWSFRLVLGLAIVALLVGKRDTLSAILGAWRGVSPLVLAFTVAFYWAGQALCVWKWQLLLRARGHVVSFGLCARLYAAGMFGNLWLPTNVGGDVLRAVLLQKSVPLLPAPDAAASILAERLTGFFALLVLGVGAVLVLDASQNAARALVWGALFFLIFAAMVGLLGRLKHPKIEKMRAALGFYLAPQNRGVLAFSLGLSLAFQISQVWLNIILARAVGWTLDGAIFWWLGPTLSLSGLIPAGIGGLGVREAAAVALIGKIAPLAQILAWSLLWQATVWGASLPGICFLKTGSASAPSAPAPPAPAPQNQDQPAAR